MNFTTSAWSFSDANSAALLPSLVEHVDISTPQKQQPDNSEMPRSRRGMQ
jgi:hypothetical protein